MVEIVLYHGAFTRSGRPFWALEEAGVPYRLEVVDFRGGAHKAPDFLALNPLGRVPVMTVDGTVMTESLGMVAWITDAFPEAGLAPAIHTPERIDFQRWFWTVAINPEPATIGKMVPDAAKVVNDVCLGFEPMLDLLRERLSDRPYLTGDRFSAVDLVWAGDLAWFKQFKLMGDDTVFDPYIARCTDRPAYKRVMAKDLELTGQAAG